MLQCLYSTVYKADERARQYLPDVIDLIRAICADNSQGNEAVFGENAGKQCVVMSFLYFHHHTNLWTTSRLSDILVIGNKLFSSQRYSVETTDYLLLTVDFIVSINVQMLQLTYHEPFSALNLQVDS